MPNRFRTPQRRVRHNRAWSGVVSTSGTAVAAATKVLLGSFNPTTSGDVTVLRTVGTFMIHSDQTAATEQQSGAFGCILVNDVALALGVTGIPGPVTEISDDGWFLYQSFHQRFTQLSAVGFSAQGAMLYQYDSKARRKVEDGRSVAIMVENSSASAGFTIQFSMRLLAEVYG